MPESPPDPTAPAFDFQRDVLAASRERPVLVDFWAPWCGPCRVLGPVLDALHTEAAGRWALVKVNTDEYPELMQAFGIRGIPAVKLFADGAVVAEFTGALPQPALRQWLDEHIPSEAGRYVQQGDAAWEAGDPAAATSAYEAALAAAEAHASPPPAWTGHARTRLARLVVFSDPDAAQVLVEDVDTPEAEAVRAVLGARQRDAADLPEGAAREAVADAHAALRDGDPDAALARLIDAVRTDRAYDDDGARRLAVALFHTLGEAHPATKTHRRAFDRSLY